jgi:NADPH-dependent curcumin reductase
MTNLAALTNHQIRLAARPVGLPTRDSWSFTTEPVVEPGAGGIVVKNLSLSLDPAMRGWMNEGKSYIAPVGIGEVMRAGGIGKVISSSSPKFSVGDTVIGGLNVQEFSTFDEMSIKRAGITKVDLRIGTLTQWLNVLGMPGMTGYFDGCGSAQSGRNARRVGRSGRCGANRRSAWKNFGLSCGGHRGRKSQMRLGCQ